MPRLHDNACTNQITDGPKFYNMDDAKHYHYKNKPSATKKKLILKDLYKAAKQHKKKKSTAKALGISIRTLTVYLGKFRLSFDELLNLKEEDAQSPLHNETPLAKIKVDLSTVSDAEIKQIILSHVFPAAAARSLGVSHEKFIKCLQARGLDYVAIKKSDKSLDVTAQQQIQTEKMTFDVDAEIEKFLPKVNGLNDSNPIEHTDDDSSFLASLVQVEDENETELNQLINTGYEFLNELSAIKGQRRYYTQPASLVSLSQVTIEPFSPNKDSPYPGLRFFSPTYVPAMQLVDCADKEKDSVNTSQASHQEINDSDPITQPHCRF